MWRIPLDGVASEFTILKPRYSTRFLQAKVGSIYIALRLARESLANMAGPIPKLIGTDSGLQVSDMP